MSNTSGDSSNQLSSVGARVFKHALAKKHGAALVHYQKIFNDATQRAPADYWIWDNVHPTYRGHQLMADEWERVVRETFK